MFFNLKTLLAKNLNINFKPSNSQPTPVSIETYNSLLCATLDSTADGILVVDTQGKFVSYNHTFAEMWGISQTTLDARDDNQVLELVRQQLKQPEEFIRKVRELYTQPDVESYDDLELNDGRYLERYSRPQRIEGKSVGRAFSFRDITKRKRAEIALQQAHLQLEIKIEERTASLQDAIAQLQSEIAERQHTEEQLRSSEERFRNLVETSSDWVWETDENYIYTYSSPQVYNILGYQPEQVIGKTPFDLMTAQEAWRVANLFSLLTENHQSMNYPAHLR